MKIYGRKSRYRGADIEKRLARELRARQGLSVNSIAKKLNRSVETVRQWTMDIILTEEQVDRLELRKRQFLK